MGSLALRPGDSLTILKMASSVGFRSFGFPPVRDSCYRAPDSCPGGTRSLTQDSKPASRIAVFRFENPGSRNEMRASVNCEMSLGSLS